MGTNNSNSQPIFEGGERVLFHSLVWFGGLFLVVMALPYLLGGPEDEATATEGPLEVPVLLAEFTIEPASLSFEAGDHVEFIIENQGSVPHEFRLTTRASADAHAAGGHEGHDDSAEGGSDEHGDIWLLIGPNQTRTLEITFDENSSFDVIACLLPGHYEEGMTSELRLAGVVVAEDDGHAHDHEGVAEHGHDAGTADDHGHDAGTADDHGHDAGTADDHGHDAGTADQHGHDAGTADDHGAMDDAAADREILIFMDEFEFDPPDLELASGETVRFTIINAGEMRHEFRFTTEHAALEHVAGSGDGHHGDTDLILPLDPGAAGTLVVTVDDSFAFDTVACFIDDHYESGLSATVNITS